MKECEYCKCNRICDDCNERECDRKECKTYEQQSDAERTDI